jgi:hypothetical protein
VPGPFDPFQQLADVIDVETGPKAAETAGLDAERLTRSRAHSHEPTPEGFIDNVFEWAARPARRGLQLDRHVLIQGQRRSHIMML